MKNTPILNPSGRLFGEAVAIRSVLGALTVAVADMTDDRAAFIRDLLAICAENIERMDIQDSDFGRGEDVRIHAHGVLQQIVGTLKGSPLYPR